MKSAYELALERFGGDLTEYTGEQKEKLAEIDRIHDSKVAQAKFAAQDRRRKSAGSPEERDAIQDDLAVEIASIEERREREKEKLRQSFREE